MTDTTHDDLQAEDRLPVAVRYVGPQATAAIATDYGRLLFERDGDAVSVPADLADVLLDEARGGDFEQAETAARSHEDVVDFETDADGRRTLVVQGEDETGDVAGSADEVPPVETPAAKAAATRAAKREAALAEAAAAQRAADAQGTGDVAGQNQPPALPADLNPNQED